MSGNASEQLNFGVESLVEDSGLVGRRRAVILDAATELFGRRGYHETTIKDIAAAADVSSGLLYSYVKSKEDVLFLIIARSLEGYCVDMGKVLKGARNPLSRFKMALRTYSNGAIRNSYQTLLAFRHVVLLPKERRDTLKSLDHKATLLLATEIEACIAAGYFRAVEPMVAAAMATHLAQAWTLKTWHFARYSNEGEFVESMLDMVLSGLMVATPSDSQKPERESVGAASNGEGPVRSPIGSDSSITKSN